MKHNKFNYNFYKYSKNSWMKDPMDDINSKLEEVDRMYHWYEKDFYNENKPIYKTPKLPDVDIFDYIFSIGEKFGNKLRNFVDKLKNFNYAETSTKVFNWIKSDLNKGKTK
jgi:hypothetical protein